MKYLLLICRHEWRQLMRNYQKLTIIAVFIGVGLYAIHYGNAVIEQQTETVHSVLKQNALEQQELINGLDADTTTAAGLAAWEKAAYPSKVRFFLNYYAIDPPDVFAKLSIGQRDVNPYYLQLNAQNLYLQMFRSEIANPRKLLTGNFDLSFVIIYLLPLLIIAFTYNLLSDEQERGTLPLLRIQPLALHKFLICKLLFWFAVTAALLLLLSGIAFIWCGITSSVTQAGWWLLITLSYTGWWFALLLLVNAFRGSSAVNAMFGLGLWLLFLIVIPAVLNLAFTDERKADATKLTGLIRRRQGLGESVQEKRNVLERFFKQYPEYKNVDSAAGVRFFDFQAYSAYVTLADSAAKPTVEGYYQQVWDRHQKISAFNIINSAVNTHNLLNSVGHSGLEDAFAFRTSVETFHRQLCHFCFKPLFAGRMMTREDYKQIPKFRSTTAEVTCGPLLIQGLGWLWLLLAVFAITAFQLIRRRL